MRRAIVVLIVCASRIAAASPAEKGSVAIAVNAPTSWFTFAHAISGYVGVHPHHAIRANVASYEYGTAMQFWGKVLGSGEVDSGTHHMGRYLDVGVSWTWFPSGLYRGSMLDIGVLRRDVQSLDTDRQNEWPAYRERDTTTYAVRAMIGYSQPLGQRGFMAGAVGASQGYRVGTETSKDRAVDPLMTYDVSGLDKSFELYLRFGVVLR